MRPKNGRNDSLDIFALRFSLQQMLSQARMLLYIAMSCYSHNHSPIYAQGTITMKRWLNSLKVEAFGDPVGILTRFKNCRNCGYNW